MTDSGGMRMARWLRTGALLVASFAVVLVLIVPPDVWASGLSFFNCDQVFGVNGIPAPGGSGYYVVGWQSPNKNEIGYQVPATTGINSCGSSLNVPGATSTTPQAISPDYFVAGLYQTSSKGWIAFVMAASATTANQVLSFTASGYSGVANAGFTRPTGISKSNLGLAWVVGYYILTTSNTTHAFAVQVNTTGTAPAIVANTWINFDIQAAGSGLARGVDGPNGSGVTRIVGEYPVSGKQQGYVMTLDTLTGAQAAQGTLVTVVPASSVATVTCSDAIGMSVHGISDSGRIVGSAFTSNTQGYAYWVDPVNSWSPGTSTPSCTHILPATKGQTWAAGISWDNTWIVGMGGGLGDWLYQQ
jgi:hypothetical protein